MKRVGELNFPKGCEAELRKKLINISCSTMKIKLNDIVNISINDCVVLKVVVFTQTNGFHLFFKRQQKENTGNSEETWH